MTNRANYKVGATRRPLMIQPGARQAPLVAKPSVSMLKRVAHRLRERGGLPLAAQLLEWAATTIEAQRNELERVRRP